MRRKNLKMLILTLLILLWLGFIWGNSAADGLQSTRLSLPFVKVMEPLLQKLEIPSRLYGKVIRKTAHVLEFAVLGALLYGGLRALSGQLSPWRRAAMAAGLSGLLAGADEWIQRYSPGRTAQLQDVALDLLGACLGIGLLWALEKRKKKGKSP